jgi:hypothetical protein
MVEVEREKFALAAKKGQYAPSKFVKGSIADAMGGAQEVYRRLLYIANEKNYKPGWAYHTAKEMCPGAWINETGAVTEPTKVEREVLMEHINNSRKLRYVQESIKAKYAMKRRFA